jgi:hypothetical protein
MSSDPTQPSRSSASLYLEQLEELIAEMSIGMEAIASNSVEALKRSVARQEALCASMSAAVLSEGHRLRELSHSPVPLGEEPVEFGIWKSSTTIRQLNLEYDALLKHSGKTISMLSALCSNHTGTDSAHPGPWSKQQTWSCEM